MNSCPDVFMVYSHGVFVAIPVCSIELFEHVCAYPPMSEYICIEGLCSNIRTFRYFSIVDLSEILFSNVLLLFECIYYSNISPLDKYSILVTFSIVLRIRPLACPGKNKACSGLGDAMVYEERPTE